MKCAIITGEMNKRKTIPLLLFFAIFSCYAYFIHFIGLESWNASSRLNLTYALAEKGTFSIDDYHQNTGDKVYHDGHYYSDKAPGPSLLAVPFYFLLKWAGVGSEKYMRYGLTLTVVGIPSAVAALLFYGILTMLKEIRQGARVILTLAYSLGTLAFPFSTVFYGHQLAAALVIAVFYLLLRVRLKLWPERFFPIWSAGLLSGAAFLCDYPAGIIVILLGAYCAAALTRKWKLILWLLGVALPVGAWLYYNHRCFGGVLNSAYAFHVTYSHQKGFLGIGWPHPRALWGITFSPYRGVFYQSPFLLLAFPGFYYLFRRKRWRREFYLCLLAFLGFLFFNSGYAYWDGVGSAGARFLIPALPFLIFPLATVIGKWPRTALALIGLSFVFMLVIAAVEPRAEWRVSNPLFYFSFFLLCRGFVSDSLGTLLGLNGWISLLPLLLFLLLVIALIRKVIPPDGRIGWGREKALSSLGVIAAVLFWIVIAGWEEPYLREYDRAESLFRYYRTRGWSQLDWEEVEDYYRRVIELDPRFMDPYLRLAELARRRGKPGLALAYYRQLLDREPGLVPLWQEKAVVHELLGQLEDAEASLKKAAEIVPRDSSVRNQLAEFYWRQGRFEEAITQWEENAKLHPDDKRIKMFLEEARRKIEIE